MKEGQGKRATRGPRKRGGQCNHPMLLLALWVGKSRRTNPQQVFETCISIAMGLCPAAIDRGPNTSGTQLPSWGLPNA